MTRRLLGAIAMVALTAATVVTSCDANLQETCVGGPCTIGGTGGWPGYISSVVSSSAVGTSSSSSGSPVSDAGDGGDGGDGEAGPPPASALDCPTTPKAGQMPCDVFKIINGICDACHTNPPVGGAPFPIQSYADTQQPYAGLKGTVLNGGTCELAASSANNGACMAGQCNGLRFQQMWISTGDDGCPQMPFGNAPLPEPDYTTLRTWLAACAPPAETGKGCGN